MSIINLNFVNKSKDANQSKIVIFQEPVNPDYNGDTIAWKVIKYCGQGDSHPFQYDEGIQISVSDSHGNYTPRLDASPGQLFQLAETTSGDTLSYKGPGSNKDEIQVLNALSNGAINVHCFRSGRLLAQKLNVASCEKAVFEFLPRISIGVLPEVTEGEVMQIKTELSLLGLKSADIVMRGGGSGKDAVPYSFELENQVRKGDSQEGQQDKKRKMNVINLNFANKSNDVDQSKIVIFQKPVNPDYNEGIIAWKVIEYCGPGDYHPFQYDEGLQISVSDSYGNYTPRLDAYPGQLFQLQKTASGHMLSYKGPGSNKDEVQVLNALPMGAVNVHCYRSGKLLAQKLNVVPGEEAAFEFLPRIFIGVLSEVTEGQVMNSAVVSHVDTELSLLGLKSADIVMKGGGPGKDAVPFSFELENQVRKGRKGNSQEGQEEGHQDKKRNMSVINLNFVNQSNDINLLDIVIFQKPVNPDFNNDIIAWKVIEYCGSGDYHPFQYDEGLQISVSDSYGNYTPRLDASPGQLFQLAETASGDTLSYKGPGSNKDRVQVLNALSMGAVNVHCYRSGKLLAQKINVVPGEKAVFEFLPRIFIGVLSEVTEGQVMNSAVVSQVDTELSLLGLESADIVMRGGGSGKDAVPFNFELENQVMRKGFGKNSENSGSDK